MMKMNNQVYIRCIMLFMCIFLIGSISGAILITPNPMNITTTIDQAKTFEITIHNTFDFDVFEFTFGDLVSKGFSFPTINLVPNELKTIQFTVSPQESFIDTIENNIAFKFNANVPEEITTYKINISENGFSPLFQVIRNGDTVIWDNKDDVFHTVESSLFDKQLLPGETFSFTFNQVGTFDYNDPLFQEFNIFNAIIESINRTSPQKVHNPTYDFIWTTDLKLIQNPTSLQLTFFDKVFTLQPTRDVGESSIRIQNVGDVIAERITLSSDSTWIEFLQNDFDIGSGKQEFVGYEIKPRIFNTEDTNKTYRINITVRASNTASFTEKISVFIPFTEVFTDITTDEGFFIWLAEVFCPANPQLLFCNPNRTVVSGSSGGIGDQNITIDISAVDWKDVKDSLSKQGTAVLRNANDFALITQRLATLDQLNKTTFENKQLQEENQRSISSTTGAIAIMIFFVVIFVFVYFIIKNYGKKVRLQGTLEERYRYRNY